MMLSLKPLALAVALLPALSCADVIENGHHVVTRTVCYQFADSTGYRPYAVVDQFNLPQSYRYVPLKSGDCVDQGYKLYRVSLHWASLQVLDAQGAPDGSKAPSENAAFKPISVLTNEGEVVNNVVQVPDSIPQVSETWIYTIVGGKAAETQVTKSYKVGDSSYATQLSFDYGWGTQALSLSGTVRSSSRGLQLLGVRGSKTLVRVPSGVARLRVLTLSGRVLRQRWVGATPGGSGYVDLGMTPPKGAFVELVQGNVHSAVQVGGR